MKSKLNDASLIAEAYSQISHEDPIEEGIGAIAGGIGKLAKSGLKAVGKEAAIVAGEVGKEGLKVAGKAAMGAGKAAIKGLDKAGQAADRGISKLAGDEELEDGESVEDLYDLDVFTTTQPINTIEEFAVHVSEHEEYLQEAHG